MKEELENLKERCLELEEQERVERCQIERQLDTAIKEKRDAKEKYEKLMKQRKKNKMEGLTGTPSPDENNSLSELISDSGSRRSTEQGEESMVTKQVVPVRTEASTCGYKVEKRNKRRGNRNSPQIPVTKVAGKMDNK